MKDIKSIVIEDVVTIDGMEHHIGVVVVLSSPFEGHIALDGQLLTTSPVIRINLQNDGGIVASQDRALAKIKKLEK